MAAHDSPQDESDLPPEGGGEVTTAKGKSQTVAGIKIFADEELHHNIKPSFWDMLTRKEIILTVSTFGLWLTVPYLRWKHTAYIITSGRLIDKQGSVTGHTTEESRFDDIVGDITASQSGLEGLLNRGTIKFEIEKQRRTGTIQRESDNIESSRREMNIERRQVELSSIKNQQEVSNTIRQIAHTSR